jgi:hypothetical protein
MDTTKVSNSDPRVKLTESSIYVGDKSMFYYIHLWMFFTVVLTVLTSFVLKSPLDKRIILLEAVISGISTTIYYFLNKKVMNNKANNEEVDWEGIALLRYRGWMFSTPIMIITFLLFLSSVTKIKLTVQTSIVVVLLDWLMLAIGYLGELEIINRTIAVITGFIPLIIIFGIIYNTFLRNKFVFINYFLFVCFVVFWSLYGIGYMWELEPRNYLYNWLDLLSKSGFGVIFAIYFLYKRFK